MLNIDKAKYDVETIQSIASMLAMLIWNDKNQDTLIVYFIHYKQPETRDWHKADHYDVAHDTKFNNNNLKNELELSYDYVTYRTENLRMVFKLESM